MKEKINEDILCLLRKNPITNQIEIGYTEIVNPFQGTMDIFSALCNSPKTSIEQIIDFIQNTKEFDQLTMDYRYCTSLFGAFQSFSANNQEHINEIKQQYKLRLLNKKENSEYDLDKAVAELKESVKKKYVLWTKAFAINKAYRLCHEDKNILTFSHRIDGWSNPVYQLTPNFSIEIKTNFGYGRASYFYTKLKYKEIEITPFSEWVDYEFAKFSEIIRYTQSHLLENQYWFEAIKFSCDACNLSITNEIEFVEKYIIDECEKMLTGLEGIFNKEHFSFKNKDKIEYKVNKKGHILVEFRGEKISGALDFISKILDFEKIASIRSFINRIEVCNKRIQPILVEESKILNVKISNLTEEKNILKPKYDKVFDEHNNYSRKRNELQELMIRSGQINIQKFDSTKFNNEFNTKYPNYIEFRKEYEKITQTFKILTEQIQNLTKVYNNIITYNDKILQYFRKQ